MKYFKWNNVRLVLMFALVIFLFAFTSKRNGERKLRKAQVIFVGKDTLFLNPEAVNKLLIENKTDVAGIQKVNLDLNRLEQSVNSNDMVEKSDVFVSIDGVLKARVKQKTPVVRVFDGTSSFYIDYKGNKMPLSDVYAARVPIVSGDISAANQKDLDKLFRFIHDDDFLKKNIIGIQIFPKGSLKMMNRNFNYEIDFGKPINIERKFGNYKAFLQKASLDSSLYKYKTINLKFTQQVVCTK